MTTHPTALSGPLLPYHWSVYSLSRLSLNSGVWASSVPGNLSRVNQTEGTLSLGNQSIPEPPSLCLQKPLNSLLKTPVSNTEGQTPRNSPYVETNSSQTRGNRECPDHPPTVPSPWQPPSHCLFPEFEPPPVLFPACIHCESSLPPTCCLQLSACP